MATVFAAGPASAVVTPPSPLKGAAPGTALVGGTNLVMAYTGTDGSVWVKDVTTGVYTPAGGHLTAGPALVASGPAVVVFGPGTDHALWMTICGLDASSCSGWTSLGGKITSKAGTVFRGPGVGDYSVYARGTNGAVWGRDHSSTTGWGAWYTTGGALYGGTGPGAAFIGGHVWLLATGTNGGVYVQEVGVSGFSFTGGYSTATPALTTISGALVGFARGAPDNAAYYHRFLSTSPGWHYFGGAFSSGLAASSNGAVLTYTFGLGTNSEVYGATGNWTGYPPTFTGWGLNT
ncbi:MAG: hypothetical protein JO132_16795 [Streptosporangiaceae bacterium]|nr:hypothetical protein [Streptosporangiaceae bacterium]